MAQRPRIVLDTNVLVSAMLSPDSVPGLVVTAAEDTSILLASTATLDELKIVLSRPKFDRFLSINARLRYVQRCRAIAELVRAGSAIRACRDPRDDKFLEVAVYGGADLIVSGDKDLLDIDPFQGIRIVTPQPYLAYTG